MASPYVITEGQWRAVIRQIPDCFQADISLTNMIMILMLTRMMMMRMEKEEDEEEKEEEDECHLTDSRFFVQINIPMFS